MCAAHVAGRETSEHQYDDILLFISWSASTTSAKLVVVVPNLASSTLTGLRLLSYPFHRSIEAGSAHH